MERIAIRTMSTLDTFIRGIPKAELHVHLEGCIEADMMFALAERNGLALRWSSPEGLRAAYRFGSLQAFLDLYYEGCRVLVQERDFYEVTRAYLRRAHADGVVRAEVFIGPQSFTARGVAMATIMNGVLAALQDASRELRISAGLLVSAQRHRSQAEAWQMLEAVLPWTDHLLGFGLGGAEVGNPPSKFADFFRGCRDRGFRVTAHAGEEGPASYVREAIDVLGVNRIDHGNACLKDPAVVRDLVERAIPLTVCPLSNLMLGVVPSLEAHPLRAMLDAGLHVTVNSDDPAYFGGYVGENFIRCQRSLGLSSKDIATLARNSLSAAFLPSDEATRWISRVDAYCEDFAQRPGV
jgi:adenosine deaminase